MVKNSIYKATLAKTVTRCGKNRRNLAPFDSTSADGNIFYIRIAPSNEGCNLKTLLGDLEAQDLLISVQAGHGNPLCSMMNLSLHIHFQSKGQ